MKLQKSFYIMMIVVCFGSFYQCGPEIVEEPAKQEPSKTDSSGDAGKRIERKVEKEPKKESDCKEDTTRVCYTGPSGTKGTGQCKAGVELCKDGEWTACVGQVTPAAKEKCSDGEDNNCDGQVDEDCGECSNGQKRSCLSDASKSVCKKVGSSVSCQAPCKAGIQACSDGKWGKCVGEQSPTLEVCDKKDNDCDGKIDNIKEEGEACKSGEKGICSPGKLKCSPFGIKICEANSKPVAEVCDGKDNDCDGKTDEDLVAPDCAKTQGVCAGLKQVCEGTKGWRACSEADYTKHNKNDYQNKETKCDGLDNNCDGNTDEGCSCKNGDKKACFNKKSGCQKVGQKYTCNLPCQTGSQICKNGTMGTCTGAIGPGTESCDGKDNDCDGKIDNNLVAPKCPNQKGACSGAVKHCGGKAGWLACTIADYKKNDNQVQATTELTCDGKDNNCDGETDETFADKDKPCSTTKLGECKPGKWSCQSGKKVCTRNPAPKTELCNGKDDDCDGQTDENLAKLCPKQDGFCVGSKYRCEGAKGWQGCTAADYKKHNGSYQIKETTCNGQDDDCNGKIDDNLTPPPCNNQRGGCSGSVKTCGGVIGWKPCTATEFTKGNKYYEATEVSCDGQDNDCDGAIDESFSDKGKACNTTKLGTCKVGTWTCQFAKKVCVSTKMPTAEICDKLDNDCDGQVDEGLIPPPCAKQKGVCAGAKKICGLGWRACTDFNYSVNNGNYEALETKCDKLDNDCDGKVDDLCVSTFAGLPTNNGTTNGSGGAARFDGPTGLAFDAIGNLYVADTNNHTIRKIDKFGNVSTFLGSPGVSGNSSTGKGKFNLPYGLFVDSNNLYVADSGPNNAQIRKISLSTGIISSSVLKGLDTPRGIVAGKSGFFFIADSFNNRILKATTSFTSPLVFAQLIDSPLGLAYDPAKEYLCVSFDTTNFVPGKIEFYNKNGLVIASGPIAGPRGMVFHKGKLYVADAKEHTVEVFTTQLQQRRTFVGVPGQPGSSDGHGSGATFREPWGVAFSPAGDMYISDTGNHTIRKVLIR